MNDTKTPAPPSLAAAHGSETDEEMTLTRDELLRRYRKQQGWHRAFAESLDGIPEIKCMAGSGIDGYRMPDEIRRIVKTLVDHCQTTWEFGCLGRAKSPNGKLSHAGPTAGVASGKD